MDAAQKMQLFENLFYVAMTIAIIGFGLAVFFFFFFDIRTVFAFMTGSAKRKTIERMEEQNSRTGRLRNPTTGSIKTENNGPVVVHPAQETRADVQMMETVPLAQSEQWETTILNQEMEAGETAVLQRPPEMGETGVQAPKPAIRFDLTENTMVIQTNEII